MFLLSVLLFYKVYLPLVHFPKCFFFCCFIFFCIFCNIHLSVNIIRFALVYVYLFIHLLKAFNMLYLSLTCEYHPYPVISLCWPTRFWDTTAIKFIQLLLLLSSSSLPLQTNIVRSLQINSTTPESWVANLITNQMRIMFMNAMSCLPLRAEHFQL